MIYFAQVTPTLSNDHTRIAVEPLHLKDPTKDFCIEALKLCQDDGLYLQSLPITQYGEHNLFSKHSTHPEWHAMYEQFLYIVRKLEETRTKVPVPFHGHSCNLTFFIQHSEAFEAAIAWDHLILEVEGALEKMPKCLKKEKTSKTSLWYCQPTIHYFRSLTLFSNIYCSTLSQFSDELKAFLFQYLPYEKLHFHLFTPKLHALNQLISKTQSFYVLQHQFIQVFHKKYPSHRHDLVNKFMPLAHFIHEVKVMLRVMSIELKTDLSILDSQAMRLMNACISSVLYHFQSHLLDGFSEQNGFQWLVYSPTGIQRDRTCLAICIEDEQSCVHTPVTCPNQFMRSSA
ncbi:hypothetical protein HMI54_006781 [Coelomomyces lativittatus]|nr:hypothetical protein HMI54_006781 [Coelomomyces lativittatus]